MSYNEKQLRDIFENYLSAVLSELDDDLPSQTVRYVLSNGGKRIRPVLCLMVAETLNVDFDKVLPFACSLEIIHNSSLVHDDLPAIDNDDFRRGKLSCHKKFGESSAILCGDVLLNFAYEHALKNISDMQGVKCLETIAKYSGIKGMLGGQFKDVFAEKNGLESKELLNEIEVMKTAKLITASVLIPTFFTEDNHFEQLKLYGLNLGVAFQIVDDVLDEIGDESLMGKTLGKDVKSGKLTSVKAIGLEESKKKAVELTQNAIDSISNIKGCESLKAFAIKLCDRIY